VTFVKTLRSRDIADIGPVTFAEPSGPGASVLIGFWRWQGRKLPRRGSCPVTSLLSWFEEHHTVGDAGARVGLLLAARAQSGGRCLILSRRSTRLGGAGCIVGHACAGVRRGGGGKSAVALVTKLCATSVSRWLLLRA
jgi:hypothetical protein